MAPHNTPGTEGSGTVAWVHGGSSSSRNGNSAWTASTTAREARLSGDESQILVEAKLNGLASGMFLLDTGASHCVITPRMAQRLGLPADTEEEAIALETPAGRIEAQMMTLRTVEVANARAGDVSTVIYPAVSEPLSGIIGLSFLRHFEFSVDPRRGVLRLKPF